MADIYHLLASHPFVAVVVAFALLFDFLNGFNDAANSIATIVVSKTLSPLQAVILAGFANFVGCFTFGVAVATTIGTNVIDMQGVTLQIVLAALIGAIVWDIIAWSLGLPTSSSHALIGGLIGAGIAHAGLNVVHWAGVFRIFAFILIAPALGILGAILFTSFIIRIFRRTHPTRARGIFRYLQVLTALSTGVGHGTNDAQKTMGVIALALLTSGAQSSFFIPDWVKYSAYSAISLGTIFGGWRIVKTMGTNITKIREMEGFCSSAAASVVLMGTSHFGIPVSTTHVIAGSIMGVGTVEGVKNVRWITARRILWAWIITIPLTALCSVVSYFIITRICP